MRCFAEVMRRVGRHSGLVVLLCGLAFAASGDAIAQSLPAGLTADQLLKLQDAKAAGLGTDKPLEAEQTVIEPVRSGDATAVSRLETILSGRAGVPLKQFGYDQFGAGSRVVLTQIGGMQDDYILGQGDEIVVSLRGQENAEYRATVDRDGRVVLPRMNPVAASGRSFGEFRRDLAAAIHRAYVSTEGFISIGKVRQINVLISGEVNGGGVLTLNGLSTVADAILVAGGVKKTGSLRNIQIVRGDKTITVDLYGVMMDQAHGKPPTLTNGDRVVVPQVGASFAVGGEVRRQAIFELPAGRKAVTLHEAMAMAGGTTLPGKFIVSLMKTMPDGTRRFVDATDRPGTVVRDGEIILVTTAVDVAYGQIHLSGAVRVPGAFSIDKFATLHDLIPSQDALTPDAYMLFGFIDRIDLKTMQHMMVPFSPLRVVQGHQNMPLQSEDRVYIMTVSSMRNYLDIALAKLINGDEPVRRGGYEPGAAKPDAVPDSQGLVPVAPGGVAGTAPSAITAPGGVAGTAPSAITAPGGVAGTAPAATGVPGAGGQPATTAVPPVTTPVATPPAGSYPPGIPDELAYMAAADYVSPNNRFFGKRLIDYRVTVSGAVHSPGVYLVAPETTLAELLVAANGLADDVDLSSYELTSTVVDNETGMETTTRNYYPATKEELLGRVLLSKDVVIFHSTYSNRLPGTVIVKGEVRYPGSYEILRNERLSDLLRRAGGMSDNAYPYGAVFLRKSLAKIEQESNMRTADQVQTQLVQAMARLGKDNQLSGDSFAALQGYIVKLREQPALGRMVVVADPTKLAADPSLDPVLESGDTLYIPSKPFSVSVMGEVLQPTSVPYRDGMTPADYIDRAGGFTQTANKDEIFVVRPDGSTYRARSSWYDFMSGEVPAGSTIYVGREIVTYDSRQFVLDITTIFSQLATTAAAMAVLVTNANSSSN